MLTTGCLSEGSSDEEKNESDSRSDDTSPTQTTTRTPTPISGEQGLSVTNYSTKEITFRPVVTEYTKGIGDADTNEIQTVTASPEAGSSTERIDTELTISSDEHTVVEDIFTVEDTPRKYYVVVEAGEFGTEEVTFTLKKGGHFRYVDLTFTPEPEISLVYR